MKVEETSGGTAGLADPVAPHLRIFIGYQEAYSLKDLKDPILNIYCIHC
jgi:hypothetical protein